MNNRIIMLFSIFITNVFADSGIDEATIQKWLVSENVFKIEEIVPIWLVGGEKGFVIALNVSNVCRNCWANYALVRPEYEQAKIIDSKQSSLRYLGGQYNGIRIILEGNANEPSIIELGSAASGQGYSHESRAWVSFEGWELLAQYEVETSYYDNSGACGKSFEFPDEYFGPCKFTQTFLNLIDTKPLKIAKTQVIRVGETLDIMRSTITAEIVSP